MSTKEIIKMCRDISKVNRFYSIIEKNRSVTDLLRLYEYVKNVSYDFYDGRLDNRYDIVKNYLEASSYVFNKRYILSISFSIMDGEYNKDFNEYEILNFIVNEVRKYLISLKGVKKFNYDKKWNIDFSNYCYIASNKVKSYCDFLGIKCRIIDIEPGYDKNASLYNDNGFHYFNIVDFDGKKFLIDLTYKQFFKVGQNCTESIGIMNFPYPVAGCFMMMSEEGRRISSDLLSLGYTLLDDDVFKTYMDAFTVSFRNGLYYDKTGDYSYKTNYTVNDYINFLVGTDSQVKREGREVLGYQKKPCNK